MQDAREYMGREGNEERGTGKGREGKGQPKGEGKGQPKGEGTGQPGPHLRDMPTMSASWNASVPCRKMK